MVEASQELDDKDSRTSSQEKRRRAAHRDQNGGIRQVSPVVESRLPGERRHMLSRVIQLNSHSNRNTESSLRWQPGIRASAGLARRVLAGIPAPIAVNSRPDPTEVAVE